MFESPLSCVQIATRTAPEIFTDFAAESIIWTKVINPHFVVVTSTNNDRSI